MKLVLRFNGHGLNCIGEKITRRLDFAKLSFPSVCMKKKFDLENECCMRQAALLDIYIIVQ